MASSSSDVLEHVSAPRETLDIRVQSVLAQKGLVCINVPNFSAAMWKQQFRLLENGGGYTRGINPWEHLNYFSAGVVTSNGSVGRFSIVIEPSGPIDVGLRFHQTSALRRWGNFAKSMLRLAQSGLSRSSPPNTFCLGQKV